jgi:hypothetical protein
MGPTGQKLYLILKAPWSEMLWDIGEGKYIYSPDICGFDLRPVELHML